MDRAEPRLIPQEVWDRIHFYERTKRLVRFLKDHPGNTLSLDDAANIANMQRSAFSRFFTRHIGVTFSGFVAAYRVEVAIKRLLQRDTSIKEIANEVGFGSITTFQRQFKKAVGMSPSEFRSQQLENRRILVESGNREASFVSRL
jgi:AraC-like DNA-binding protein